MDFLLSLEPKMRAKAFSEIELLKEHGSNLREPYVKPIKGNTFVLLHGFVKKSNKTPERELERARKYKMDYERRCDDE